MRDDIKDLADFLSMEAKDPAKPLFLVGAVVGSWRILSYLGGGGFGEVYRVEHTRVGITCALKVLRRETENARARFDREVSFVAGHGNSGTPRFYEVASFEGRPYFVMEELEPRELPSVDRDIAALMKSLCAILSELHKEGFVHRDIKPSNILYRENGEVVLVDYGLIKKGNKGEATRATRNELTKASVVVGTERYAAPEQLSGKAIDCHADIHALGVLIDACFCGHVPRRWQRIVCRATSSLAEQRYPSCDALSTAISLRFAGEIVIVLATVLMIALAAVFMSKMDWHKGDNASEAFGAATNREHSVGRKNVSDAAGDWLLP